jgi:monoamine oxidase
LVMGDVRRVALQLDEPFWTDRAFAKRLGDERLDTLSFLHGSAATFPVWWTTYPVRAPVLVGWCGGPDSRKLAGKRTDEIVSLAVASIAKLLGVARATVARHLVAGFSHDWTSDPFSLGAYSYVAVAGDAASKRLARGIDGTLFLAGEHADAEGRNGTVHGAVASGQAAAEKILA